MKENIILGCSGSSLWETESPEMIFARLKRAGFQSVDFWMYRYSLKPEDPMLKNDWKTWVRSIYEKIRDTGLIAGQIHGILNTFIPEDFHFEPPGIEACRNLEACRMMDCGRIVFHPAFYVRRVPDEDTRKRILDYNCRWFGMLADTAKEFRVQIQLENTFDFARVQQPGDPPWPFTEAEDLLAVIGEFPGEIMAACLDTGHAGACGQDVPSMIRRLEKHLGTVHLNDNFGNIAPIYPDLHLFPGYGSLCWDEIMTALKQTGFSGIFNLEPVGALHRLPPRIRDIQLKAAADILREMAAAAGF